MYKQFRSFRTLCLFFTLFTIFSLLIGCADKEEDATKESNSYTLSVPSVKITGTGTNRLSSISLSDSKGLCNIGGTELPCLSYETTKWAEFDLILYHVLAPQNDTINVMYLYCRNQELFSAWHEDYSSPMANEIASGSCLQGEQKSITPPEFVILTAFPSPDQLVEGFAVKGSSLTYNNGTGTVIWENQFFDLYPFEVVDCTSICSASPADGWWELHSVMVDSGGRLCFGILYLMLSNTARVQLGYPICVNPIEIKESLYFDAAWSKSNLVVKERVPMGPRIMGADHILRPHPSNLQKKTDIR